MSISTEVFGLKILVLVIQGSCFHYLQSLLKLLYW